MNTSASRVRDGIQPRASRRIALAHVLQAGASMTALVACGAAAQTVVTATTNTTVVTPAAQAGTPIVISTTDIRGTVALNRFTDFQVARPDTVTMVLPTAGGQQITHLVNLVDSANGIRIDGTVVGRYGSPDGVVGGHLLFAAPGGIVIGEGAKVYAGRVSLVSSSAGRLQSAFDAADPVAAMLGVGTSGGNAVTVGGAIYAPGGVTMRAPTVTIGAAGVISAGLAGSRGLIAAGYVQTTLPEADRIIVGGDGAIELVADKVSAEGGASLDARRFDYGAGGVTAGGLRVTAPDVAFGAGSRVTAWDADTGRGGTVTIDARQSAVADQIVDALARMPSATAKVVLAGSIDARDIAVTAKASATTEASFVSTAELAEDVLGLGSAYAGLKAAVAKVDATSTIAVASGASLTAHGGGLVLAASTDAVATANADRLTTFGQSQVELGVVYAQLDATAKVTVGGTLSANGAVSLSAVNTASTDAGAVTYGRGANGLAVAIARETINATVDTTGATIDAAGSLTARAYNQEAFRATAASYQVPGKDGAAPAEAGGAAVVALRDIGATATLGGVVTVTGAAPSVSVSAGSDSTHDEISALTLTGNPPKTVETKALVESAPIALGQALYGRFSNTKENKPNADVAPHDNLAAAFTLELSTQAANATIAPGARIVAPGAAIDIAARTRDGIDLGDGDLNDGIVKNTASAAVSVKRKDSENKQASTALAFSIGIKEYVSHATVGAGATIDAGSLGVTADASRDYTAADLPTTPSLDIDGIQEYAQDLGSGVFTNQAVSSAGEGTGNAYVGSVAFNSIDADTRAWADSRARLTLAADSATRKALSIAATTLIETTQLVGKLKLGLGASGGDRAGGGALGLTLITPTTIAGIADGVTVTTDGTVAVKADATLTSLTLAALSAGGKGIGVSGTFAGNVIDGLTHATISNTATIDAATVTVDALSDLDLWSSAGALATSTGGGSQTTQGSVGVSGAANLVTLDTHAGIDGNERDDAAAPAPGERVLATGRIAADIVSVGATTTGRIGTLAVAGAYSGNTSDTAPGAFTKLKAKGKAAYDVVDTVPQKLVGVLATLTGQQRDKQADLGAKGTPAAGTPSTGFGIAGSATATVTDLDTSATVGQAIITARAAPGAEGSVTVAAAGDTDLYSVSGSGAIGRAKADSAQTQSSLAGAIGIQLTDNQVAATIADSDLSGHRDTIVLAVTRGDRIAAGLGLAVDLSKQKVSSRNFAASVTYSHTDDSAAAAISGGSVTGLGNDRGTLRVGALNSLEMGLGSGGLTFEGKAGLGIAVTVADAGGGASAAVTAKVAAFDAATIVARNAAQIVSVGAAVAVSTRAGANQFFGAGIANLIDMDSSATLDTGAGFAVGGALSVVAGGSDPVDWLGLASRPDGVSAEADDYSVSREKLGLDSGQGGFDTAIGLGKAAFNPGARVMGIAGGVGATGQDGGNSAGVNIAYNQIDNDAVATITGSGMLAAGTLSVSAGDSADILGAAVGAAIGGQTAAMGSLTVNRITGTVSASVGAADATIGTGGASVTAAATGGVFSLAGQFVRGNSAGGAAVAYNELVRDGSDGSGVTASLSGTRLTSAGDVLVGATSTGTIRSAAAAGANATAGAALTGGATANVIQTDVSASIGGATVTAQDNGTRKAVRVDAKSQGTIDSLALGVAFGQGSGDGFGVAVNRLDPTVSASIARSSITAASLATAALADSTIHTLAAGVGKAELASAASVVVNLMGGTVSAAIGDGSSIDTTGTTSVTAEDTGTADAFAGELAYGTGAALGLTSTINKLTAATSATVSGSTLTVGNTGVGATVNAGTLHTPVAQSNSLAAFANTSMAQDSVSIHGLAINAASARRLRVAGGAVAAGSVALGASVGVNLVAGSSVAKLDGAMVAATGGADVDVRASNIAAGVTALVSLAPSSGNGVAGAANAEVYSARTEAVVSGGSVTADTLDVQAISTQTIGSLAAGGGTGSNAAGLAGIGMSLSTFTSARIGGGAIVDTNALTIDAHNAAGLIGGALGIGIGSSAALGASLLVVYNDGTVEALLGGDDGDTGKPAATIKQGSVSLSAKSSTDLGTYAASGGASLAAGAAGTGIAVVQKNVTHAIAQDAAIGASDHRAGAVSLLADNALTMRAISGAAGVGISPTSVGIGLGATVLSVQSDVVAQASDTTIFGDALSILSRDDSQIDTNAWTAAIGAAAVSANAIYLQFGTDAESNAFFTDRSIGGTGGGNRTLAAMGTRAPTGGALASGDLSAADRAALAKNMGVAGAVKNNAGHRIVASIGGASTIDAANVTVDAAQGLRTITRAGNISAGPLALAGTVGLVRGYSNVAATIDDGADVTVARRIVDGATVAGAVTVSAGSDERLPGASASAPDTLAGAYPGAPSRAAEGYAVLGTAAIAGGNVGYVDVKLKNNIAAAVGGTVTGDGSGALSITASDGTDAAATTLGLSTGLATLSGSIARAARQSTTAATLSATVRGFGATGVTARDTGRVETLAIAGTGTLIGGSAAYAQSLNTTIVSATVAGAGSIADGTTSVSASATPLVSAKALGVAAAGGIAVGASVAEAAQAGTIAATVGAGARVGGALTVGAALSAASGPLVSANAIAGAGAGLAGAVGTRATASNSAGVFAAVGTAGSPSAVVLGSGALSITADRSGDTVADATGIGVGGLVGLGANFAVADGTGTTSAILGQADGGARGDDDLTITAKTHATVQASATAGSGGVIAGAGADARTIDNSLAVARFAATPIDRGASGLRSVFTAGRATIEASQVTTGKASANTVTAAALGASGAIVRQTIGTTTLADVTPGATLVAGYIVVQANGSSTTGSPGEYVADAGSGGIVNGAAIDVLNSITPTVRTQIGAGAVLAQQQNLVGDAFGTILIGASNTYRSAETARMNTYSAVASPLVKLATNAVLTTDTSLGENAQASGEGYISITASNFTDIDHTAYNKVYGGASYGAANVATDVTGNARVTLDTAAQVVSLDDVRVVADASYGVDSESQVYNWTFAPLSTDADASARVSGANTVTLGTGSTVLAGGDVTLGAAAPSVNAKAHWEEHSTYRAGLADIANAFGANVSTYDDGDGDKTISVSGGLTMLGGVNVIGGAFARRAITIDDGPDGTLNFTTEGFDAITLATPDGTGVLRFGNTATGADDLMLTRLADGSLGIGAFTANGGNVTIDAPSVTANGAQNAITAKVVDVDITSNSTTPISIGGIDVPIDRGGTVKWSGGALSAANLVVSQASDDQLSTIGISTTANGGDLAIRGEIDARTADLAISVLHANYYQTAPISVRGYTVDVPNGDINIDLTNQTYAPVNAMNFWRGQAGVSLTTMGGTITQTSATEIAAIAAYAGFLGSKYLKGLGVTTGTLADLQNRVNQFWVSPLLGGARDTSTIVGPVDRFGTPTRITVGAQTSWAWGGNYAANNDAGPVSNFTCCGYPGIQTAYTSGGRTNSFSLVSVPMSVFKQGWDTTRAPFEGGSFDTATNSFLVTALTSAAKPVTANAISAQNILISAQTIDLNGKVNVGSTPLQDVTITTALDTQFRNYAQSRGLANGTLVSIDKIDPARDRNQPSFSYVVGENRYVVNDVTMTAGPRAVFRGVVLNTNPLGSAEIVVNDGQGTINVVNQTTAGVTLNKVDAGAPRQGSVEFTYFSDYTKFSHDSVNNLVITKSERNPLDSSRWGPDSYTRVDDKTGYYNPAQGSVYQWTDTANVVRNYLNDRGVVQYMDSVYDQRVEPWVYSGQPTIATSGSYLGSDQHNAMVDGIGFGEAAFSQRVTATVTGYATWDNRRNDDPTATITGDAPINQIWAMPQAVTIKTVNTARADFPIKISFTGDPVGKVNLTSNGTLALDGPISNPTGTTTISAVRGMTIGATTTIDTGSLDISNFHGGIGAIDAPLIVKLADGGTLKANASDWYARPADIAINTQGGDTVLASVHATGDIAITALEGSLLGTGAQTAGVVGNNITLSAPIGSVGTIAKPVYIAYSYGRDFYYDPNGPSTGGGAGDTDQPDAIGVLNVAARDGVAITSQGPMRVGLVYAPNAPVRLESIGGDIVSANNTELLDPEAVARLAAAYDALKLRGADSDDAIGGVVTAFNAKFARDLSEYGYLNKGLSGGTLDASIRGAVTQQALAGLAADIALIRDLRTKASIPVASGKVRLSIAQAEGLRDFARLQLGRGESDTSKLTTAEITGAVQRYYDTLKARIVAVAGTMITTAPRKLSATQVDAYARLRVSTLSATFDDLFGASKPFDSLGLGANGQQYSFDVRTDANLRQVSTVLRDGTTQLQSRYDTLIGGATWQDQWLDVRIPGDALVPVSATRLTDATPNIVGKTVDIVAQGNVGGFGNAVTIHYDGDSSKLSNTQKALLASAGSGDISFVTNGDGSIDFTVARDRLLQIEASGAITIDTQGRAFVGAKGDLAIGTVAAQAGAALNDVRLVAGGSIVATRGDAGGYDITGNALRLEAGSGAIGAIARPIRVAVTQVESARAARDITLDSLGSLRIGNVFAGGFLSLSGADISSMFDSAVVHIRADGGARFSAIEGIGTADRALQLASGNYALNSRYGGIYVNAPTGSLAITGLDFAADEDHGFVRIGAAQNLGVTFANPRAYGGIELAAGGTLTLGGSANMLLNQSSLVSSAGNAIRLTGTFALDGWTIRGIDGGTPDLTIDGALYMPFLGISNVGDVRVNGSLYGDYGFALDTDGVFSTGIGATVGSGAGGHLNAGTVAFSDRSTVEADGGSQDDPFRITSAGAVELGKVTGGGWLSVSGADIGLRGVVSNRGLDVIAGGTLTVARNIAPTDYLGLSGADLVVSGIRLLSATRVALDSDGAIDTRNYVVRGGTGGVSITSPGAITLRSMTTPGVLTLRGSTIETAVLEIGGMDALASGTLTARSRIVSSGLVRLRAADIAVLGQISGGSLDAAATGTISVMRDVRPAGSLTLDAAILSITSGRTLAANDVKLVSDAALSIGDFTLLGTNSLWLQSDAALGVRTLTQTGDIVLRGRDIAILGDVTARSLDALATDTLAITDGVSLDAGRVALDAASAIDASRFAIAGGGAGLTLRSASDVTIGAMAGLGSVSLTGRNVSLLGTLSATQGNIAATASGTLSVTNDVFAAGALSLHASDLAVTDGVGLSGALIDLGSDGAIDATRFALDDGRFGIAIQAGGGVTVGALSTGGALRLSGGGLTIRGSLQAVGALSLDGAAIAVLPGAELAGGSLDVTGTSLSAAGVALSGANGLSVTTIRDQTIGSVRSLGDVKLKGAAITVGAANGAGVTVTATSDVTLGGDVIATSALGITGRAITSSAGHLSGDGVTITGSSLAAAGSAIDGGFGAVTIDTSDGALSTGAIIAGDHLSLYGSSITTGALTGNGVELHSAGAITVNGGIDARPGSVWLGTAGDVTITGAAVTGRYIRIDAASLTAGATTFTATSDLAQLQVTGNMTIGAIGASGDVTLRSADLRLNGDATALGALLIDAAAISLPGTATLSGASVSITGQSFDAAQTGIDSDGGVSITTQGGGTGRIDVASIDARGPATIEGQAITIGELNAGDTRLSGDIVTLGGGVIIGRFDAFGSDITVTDHLAANQISLSAGRMAYARALDALEVSVSGNSVTLGDIGLNNVGTVKVRAFDEFRVMDGTTLRGTLVDIGARTIGGGAASTIWAERIRLDAIDAIDFAGSIYVTSGGDMRAGGGPDRFSVGQSNGSVTVSYGATPLPALIP